MAKKRKNTFSRLVGFLFMAVILLTIAPQNVAAHWCSNIYQDYARIIVKPEMSNISLSNGESCSLKVRVRNNFPYTLEYIRLRADNPANFSVSVDPLSVDVVQAGQEATFTLDIQRTSGDGDVNIGTDLNLQVSIDVQGISVSANPFDSSQQSSGWMYYDAGNRHKLLEQDLSYQDMEDCISLASSQSLTLNFATLADVDESAGVSNLQSEWTSSTLDNVSSESSSNFVQPQHDDTRAGMALAVRLRFNSFSSPSRAEVVSSMIERMTADLDLVRGLAAFFAAYGGNDSGVQSAIQDMADNDSSADAQIMAKASLHLLGVGNYGSEVSSCSDRSGTSIRDRWVKSTCAAALGILGDDSPVNNVLESQVSNGGNTDWDDVFNCPGP
jgi:hypothetical protein